MEGQAESPRLMRRRIAYGLVDMRDELGLTQADVAARVGVKQQTLASIEGERTLPREETLQALLREYGREAEVDGFLAMREIAKRRDPQWRGIDMTADPIGYADYVGLESGATEIEGYELRLIPGLLQTRAYAEHVIKRGQRSGRGLDRKVDIRLRRQDILTRDNNPAHLWMIIEEHALTHPAAPPEVMAEQYGHLLALADLDNVQLQVVPRSAGAHVGLTTSFVALRFASPKDPGLVAVETEIVTHFYERPAEIKQYATVMDHLRTIALNQEESARLINTLRQQEG